MLALAAALIVALGDDHSDGHHPHHHHHGHHHNLHKEPKVAPVQKSGRTGGLPWNANKKASTMPHVPPKAAIQSHSIVEKMKSLEVKLAAKVKERSTAFETGHLLVNGPLPADFNERFAQSVAHAVNGDARTVHVTAAEALENDNSVFEITFQAPQNVVQNIEQDAANPDSKLAKGNMHQFLVAKNDGDEEKSDEKHKGEPKEEKDAIPTKEEPAVEAEEEVAVKAPKEEVTPVESKGIDIDTQMPYGDLEPFGREDTAQELTEASVKDSDGMVDQIERAEVAEEKRSVFRALTRLRGAAITSFDGVARSQTGNIDEYNKIHKWRNTHPLHHLADEESDVSKWAFPDNADLIQINKSARL